MPNLCVMCSKNVICAQTDEDEGTKTYLTCLDCNPDIRWTKKFSECKFSCQRHRYSSILNTCYAGCYCPGEWKECIVCVECHRKHLRDDEIKAVNKIYNQLNDIPQFAEVMPYIDILRSDRTKLRLRVLAYLGFLKVRYLLEHKRFLAHWVCEVQNELNLGNHVMKWPAFVDDVHRKMLAALEICGHTRRSSPKSLLKGVARFIIVCRRYREAFYAPASGNYVKQGEQRFNERVKRQKT